MEFDVGKWAGKILYESGKFEVLYEYSTNEKYLKEHINNREIIGSGRPEKISNLPSSYRDSIINALSSSVSEALVTMCNNMNVIAVAFVEGMMKELAVCVFVKHPARMYQYIGDNETGTVSLKLILNEDSKETLMLSLANMGASTLLKGKFSSNIKNLEEITKSSVPEDLKKRLIEIVQHRNEFVHESKAKTLTNIDVKKNFDDVYDFLKWMGTAALKQNVPVNDPAYLVVLEHA